MGMTIIYDPGHGNNCPGKRSPDGRLEEWAYTREIVAMVYDVLKTKDVDVRILVPEKWDVSLNERVRRVNALCSKYGSKNVALVSVHVNAAGSDGKWHGASGFSVWVAKQCSSKSKKLAQLHCSEAEKRKLMGNRWIPKDRYWQANFAVVKNTNCPAILTENLFQDNKEDVDYLLSDEGKKAIVDLHVDAIMNYIKLYG